MQSPHPEDPNSFNKNLETGICVGGVFYFIAYAYLLIGLQIKRLFE